MEADCESDFFSQDETDDEDEYYDSKDFVYEEEQSNDRYYCPQPLGMFKDNFLECFMRTLLIMSYLLFFGFIQCLKVLRITFLELFNSQKTFSFATETLSQTSTLVPSTMPSMKFLSKRMTLWVCGLGRRRSFVFSNSKQFSSFSFQKLKPLIIYLHHDKSVCSNVFALKSSAPSWWLLFWIETSLSGAGTWRTNLIVPGKKSVVIRVYPENQMIIRFCFYDV